VLSATASRWLAITDGRTFAETLEGNPLQRNVFTGLLAAGLFVLARRWRETLRLLQTNIPIVLFLGYCLLSTQWSDFPDIAFKRWIKALGDFVMVMVVLTESERSLAIKRFIAWTGFFLVPLSLLLMEFYPEMGRELRGTLLHGRVRFIGITNDKNMLGAVGLIFGLGAAWRLMLAFREKSTGRTLFIHGSILAGALWISWRANSMTSFATFLLTMAVLVVCGIPMFARRRTAVHLAAFTVVLLASIALFFDFGSGMVETLGRDSTLTGRTDLWDELLAMNTNGLLGTGFESFWMGDRLEAIWRVHWWHPNEAHNGYIEVFLNLGWAGIFLLMIVLLAGYFAAVGSMRREPEVGGLRLTFVVAVLIYSGSEAGFRLLTPVWICSLLGAFILPRMRLELATAADAATGVVPLSPAPVSRLAYTRRTNPVPPRRLTPGSARSR
jgi:exopolysaccharide production protein ExoQ